MRRQQPDPCACGHERRDHRRANVFYRAIWYHCWKCDCRRYEGNARSQEG